MKGPTAQPLLCQISKPTFDQVQPRRRSGRKVQVKTRIAAQPAFDARVLAGGIVIHDQVQLKFSRCLLIDVLQEADEYLMPVLRHAVANDLDRKSTRLNSSHSSISYAVFCFKKNTI